jgi:uncharacterized protein (DUF58 family)
MNLNSLQKLLSTDFCPWANRYVYWLKQPIGWIVLAAIASVLVGVFHSRTGWLMLACFLALMALGTIWPWLQIQVARCEVDFDRHRINEEETAVVTLRVTNRSPIPLFGLSIENGFFAGMQSKEEAVSDDRICISLSRIPPFSTNAYRWNFVPARRGLYPASDLILATGFPFGIWTARKPVQVLRQLIVWPRTVFMPNVPEDHAATFFPVGVPGKNAGDQHDYLGVRPWRPGESLRSVNWARSARTEEDIFVVERESCSRKSVEVDMQIDGCEDEATREWILRIGATLTRLFHGHHYQISAGLDGRLRPIRPSRHALSDFNDFLATFDSPAAADAANLPVVSGSGGTRYVISSAQASSWRDSAAGSERVHIVLGRDPVPHPAGVCFLDVSRNDADPFRQLSLIWRQHCRADHAA